MASYRLEDDDIFLVLSLSSPVIILAHIYPFSVQLQPHNERLGGLCYHIILLTTGS